MQSFHDDALSMQELFDDFEADCKRRKLRGMDRIVSHMKPLRAWFGAMDAPPMSTNAVLTAILNTGLGWGAPLRRSIGNCST